jgi:hypothetical protein
MLGLQFRIQLLEELRKHCFESNLMSIAYVSKNRKRFV